MMLNCPRCGFSQPQDQYCASCGVDMQAFRPAKKAVLKRLAGSMVFQIGVLAVVVLVAFSFAGRLQDQERAQRRTEIESAQTTQVVSRRVPVDNAAKSEMASTSPPPSQQATATAAALALSAAPKAGPSQTTPGAAGSASPSAQLALADDAAKPAAAAKSAETPAQSVQITFAAVSRAALAELIAAGSPATLGPVSVGVLGDISKRMQALRSTEYFEVLDSSSQQLKNKQPAQFLGGQREETTGQFLGLAFEVALSESVVGDYQIHGWHYLREGMGVQETSIALPDNLSIPKGSAAFIVGALPARTSEQDRRFYDPIKVLHIFASEPFKNGLTELLVIIQPR